MTRQQPRTRRCPTMSSGDEVARRDRTVRRSGAEEGWVRDLGESTLGGCQLSEAYNDLSQRTLRNQPTRRRPAWPGDASGLWRCRQPLRPSSGSTPRRPATAPSSCLAAPTPCEPRPEPEGIVPRTPTRPADIWAAQEAGPEAAAVSFRTAFARYSRCRSRDGKCSHTSRKPASVTAGSPWYERQDTLPVGA